MLKNTNIRSIEITPQQAFALYDLIKVVQRCEDNENTWKDIAEVITAIESQVTERVIIKFDSDKVQE